MSMNQAAEMSPMAALQKVNAGFFDERLNQAIRAKPIATPISGEIEELQKSVSILGEELGMLIRSIQPICRPIAECSSEKACQAKEIASPSQLRGQLQSIRESVALLTQRIMDAKAQYGGAPVLEWVAGC